MNESKYILKYLLLFSFSAARRTENGVDKHPKDFQTDHATEYVDSGLGESNNNQRPHSDPEYHDHKSRNSSMSIETPEFCEHYQCISSPKAPPSQASSVLSVSDDPWTRQSFTRSSYRFEDRCMDVSHLSHKIHFICPRYMVHDIKRSLSGICRSIFYMGKYIGEWKWFYFKF